MLKFFNKTKIKGFTLAEVLITLGIIGVVAAITIPTLINNTQKVEYVTALKKAYSILNQVHEEIIADDDELLFALKTVNNSEEFGNIFSERMKLSENCETVTSSSACFPDGKDLNNNTLTIANLLTLSNNATDGNAFVANDGISYFFILCSKDCDVIWGATSPLDKGCGIILLDSNGPQKGPSKLGRDWFIFAVTSKGIYPWGMQQLANTVENDCHIPSTGTPVPGMYCTVKVISENAMNY